jgi:hypothetical protein
MKIVNAQRHSACRREFFGVSLRTCGKRAGSNGTGTRAEGTKERAPGQGDLLRRLHGASPLYRMVVFRPGLGQPFRREFDECGHDLTPP